MSKITRRRVLAGVVALAASAGLAACGSKNSDETTTTAAATETTAAATETTVALTGTGTELWRITPGEPVPVDIQRPLWSVGRFYAAGGSVEVDTHWRAEQWPKSEEVQALEEALGLKVHAAYHRRLGPNPFPAPLLEFG